MKTKLFENKEITVREINKADLRKAKKFQDFINSLTEKGAHILINEKMSIKDEIKFLEGVIKTTKKKTKVFLVAEYDDKVIGTVSVELEKWRRNHIGKFGIAIRDGYRGVGLGKYLMSEIIKLAKRELKPKPKMIQLEVYVNNKIAINFYKKMGFKTVGKIPKQIQYKGKLIDEFIMILYL